MVHAGHQMHALLTLERSHLMDAWIMRHVVIFNHRLFARGIAICLVRSLADCAHRCKTGAKAAEPATRPNPTANSLRGQRPSRGELRECRKPAGDEFDS